MIRDDHELPVAVGRAGRDHGDGPICTVMVVT